MPSRIHGEVTPAGASLFSDKEAPPVARAIGQSWRACRRAEPLSATPAASIEGQTEQATQAEIAISGGCPGRDEREDELPSHSNEEVEYPLPGSEAMCDQCGSCVFKYWHCVQCGTIEGFDLCQACYREGTHNDKHERRHPTHKLRMVTPHTAPVVMRKPQLLEAPSARPPPRATDGAVSERVHIPKEAKLKHSWTQHEDELYLTVELPIGTRARDLIVVIEPFKLSISLKGYGIVLRGSFCKGIRSRDSTWTIEDTQLKLLLAKSVPTSWKRLFPEDEELHPMQAIKQICENPDPPEHSYMDLTPEAKSFVDLHRAFRHAKATGDVTQAQELEEEMKLMRFRWSTDS